MQMLLQRLFHQSGYILINKIDNDTGGKFYMTSADRPKFQITFSGAPKGEAAFVKAIEFAQRAFSETYPTGRYSIMGERQDRIIPLDMILVKPLDEMRQLQEVHKPSDDILLYRAVILAGLPEDEAKKKLYQTYADVPYYLDVSSSDRPYLHIAREAVEPLFLDDPTERAKAAIKLGAYYLSAVCEGLSNPQPVADNIRGLVRILAKDALLNLMDDFKEYQSVNGGVLAQAQDMVFSLLEEDRQSQRAEFVASGAKFAVVLPGQSLVTAEFATGVEFDEGVQCYLAVPVGKRFSELIEANFKPGLRFPVPQQDYQRARYIQSMLAAVGLRSRDEVLQAYASSDLPFHIIGSDNPRLNIQQYIQ